MRYIFAVIVVVVTIWAGIQVFKLGSEVSLLNKQMNHTNQTIDNLENKLSK